LTALSRESAHQATFLEEITRDYPKFSLSEFSRHSLSLVHIWGWSWILWFAGLGEISCHNNGARPFEGREGKGRKGKKRKGKK